jgi:hypothetical protein
MYAFARESGHVVWKKWWYAFILGVSLRVDIYMTREDRVFVVNVVVIDLMQKTLASNVISRPIGAVVELIAIVKICKYRWFHEGHHFIPMAMEVHGTPMHDMDRFIGECASLFDDR